MSIRSTHMKFPALVSGQQPCKDVMKINTRYWVKVRQLNFTFFFLRCLTVFTVCFSLQYSFSACAVFHQYRLKAPSVFTGGHGKFSLIHIFSALIPSARLLIHSTHRNPPLWLFLCDKKKTVLQLLLLCESLQSFQSLIICEYVYQSIAETQLPELLQRPVISPVLEEIAGLCIPLTSGGDMIPLTSERGPWASFLRIVWVGCEQQQQQQLLWLCLMQLLIVQLLHVSTPVLSRSRM